MTRLKQMLVLLLAALGPAACRAPMAVASGDSPAPEPVEPAPQPQHEPARPAWYEPEIRAFEAADRTSPPQPGQVLFIGSSSIRLWKTLADDMAPMPVLNRGFGGSRTSEVLEVFGRIVTPYRPAIIVYYCGDNDLGTDNSDFHAAADGFMAFDQRARTMWPAVQVFYIPIKASIARWSNWPAMRKANQLVRAYCERTPGATYLDTVTPTLTGERTRTGDRTPDPALFRDDGLHLNEKGYAVWTSIVRPAVLRAWNDRRLPEASNSLQHPTRHRDGL